MKTLREQSVGKSLVRLLQTSDGYAGLVIVGGKRHGPFVGDDPDELRRKLLTEVGRASPDYFGFDGARARFLREFTGGFSDPRYAEHERIYKDEAVAKIASDISLDTARQATAADCAGAARAFSRSNLVFSVENARIRQVLKGAAGSDYLQAAAAFADGDVEAGLTGMISAIRVTDPPSWPILTYLPFFWRPDHHMFLKPGVTRDFAARVGHRFNQAYDSGLTASTYESLLDLAAQTSLEIADLEPKDQIDIQSFIWVVGAYDDPA